MSILAAPTTVVSTESTLANRQWLAPEFVDQILALYQGTTFAESEIEGRMVDRLESAWFGEFQESRHVKDVAIVPGLPVCISIDAGTSRTTAAVFFQAVRIDTFRVGFIVHDAYLNTDMFSADNAVAIMRQFRERFGPIAEVDRVYIDGTSSAKTSIGPAALGEYQRVFG